MLVYISGKYTGKTEEEVASNIKLGKDYAVKLWDAGMPNICPMTNTAFFEKYVENTTYDDFLNGDFEMILRCDAVFLLPGWKDSKGARKEVEFCTEHKIFFTDEFEKLVDFSKHVDNDRFTEMRKIQNMMYRTSLTKNADYSPANVLCTGHKGVLVRCWDKMARWCNLEGLDISTGIWSDPKNPKHEALDDTILDLANYCVIALILRRNKWAKWTQNGIK